MDAPVNSRRRYRFGLFEADPASGELLRKGVRVRLQDQPFHLLVILLERAGEVVPRENIRQQLWPADTFVEFDGSLNAALKRLRSALGDSSENPIFIETIPKRGYRFIAPVMVEEKPADPDVRVEVPQKQGAPAVGAPNIAALVVQPPPVHASRSFRVYAFILAAAVVALLGAHFLRQRMKSAASSIATASSVPARKSVAVLGFANASGRSEDDWLATSFSEMLSTELSVGDKLRLVPAEEVANLRLSTPWPQASTLAHDTAVRVGTALNSDVLLLGSYTSVGDADRNQLRLDVRLQDSRTGEVLAEISQTCGRNDLFQATSEIGAKLRDRLGVPEIRDTEEAQVLASLPLNREAARFYALGIARLRDFDALAAKDLLVQAARADPKFSLAHLMLARAWSQLGYEQKRKEEAKAALELSTDLPRTERLLVEGDYYESVADHEKAASAYRALHELFPDSVDYGLQLVAAENAAGHGSQALETIGELRRLPPAASLDPRIDIAESIIPSRRVDSLALLKAAAGKATAQGKKLVYARARLQECMQFVYGGRTELTSEPCEGAYNIYLAAGNRLMAADAVRLIADQQGGEGHLAQAIASYQRALKILEGLGDYLKTATILNNMAIAYTTEGDLDRAEQLYRRAKSDFEEAGDKHNAAVVLVNIADILYLRGRLASAAKTYQQVIDLENTFENGDPVYAMDRLADLELTQGKVRDAHRLAAQAIDFARSKSLDVYGAMSELGEVLEAEGDLNGARQQEQSAVEIRRARGRNLEAAENLMSLAKISLEEGHPDQAENSLRQAMAEFEKEKAVPDTAAANTLLSRIFLSQGKIPEARSAIHDAAEQAKGNPDPFLQIPIAIQEARITTAQTAEGKNSPASAVRNQLHATILSTKSLGYYRLECEARLALGELEMKLNSTLGRSLMKDLAAETESRGLHLVSKKALAMSATRAAS